MKLCNETLDALNKRACSTRLLGLWASAALILGACGPSHQDLSNTRHSINEPTRSAEAWQWVDVSADEANTIVAPLLGLSEQAFLPSTHALVQRTQFWLDHIDSVIREKSPDLLAKAPKPIARVLVSADPNAFVAPVPVCYKVPVQIQPFGSGGTVDRVLLSPKSGSLGTLDSDLKCVDGATKSADLAGFVSQFNASSLSCKYQLRGSGTATTLIPNANCALSKDLGTVKAARSVVILGTANIVHVHAGLFLSMNESQIVSILGHELAHYYRSHLNAATPEYDYYYILDRTNPTKKPAPEPSLRQAGTMAFNASYLLTYGDMLGKVSGQKLRSELYFGVGTLINEVCAEPADCSETCSDAVELMNDRSYMLTMASFPVGYKAEEKADAQYKVFENKALACLEEISLVEDQTVLSAKEIGWGRVSQAVDKPSWPQWLGELKEPQRSMVEQVNFVNAYRVGKTPPNGANLAEVLTKLSTEIASDDAVFVDILRQANQMGLGQYTVEQEADDQSSEWLAAIGLNPQYMMQALSNLGKNSKGGLGGFLLSDEECLKLYQRRWLNEQGAYAFVPIGNYAENHHSICYRMWNIAREIEAHRYEVAEPQAEMLSGAEWNKIKMQALLATSGLSVLSPSKRRFDDILKEAGFGECTFSYAYRNRERGLDLQPLH